MRLLVVEDNEQLAKLLAKGLQTAGYDTDVFGTVAEARTALLMVDYAAMILDLGLPDGDGLAVLRELRHRKDPVPVLVLTARGGLQDRIGGLAARATPRCANFSSTTKAGSFQRNRSKTIFSACPVMSPRTPSKSTCIV